MTTYFSGRFLNPILSQSNGIKVGEEEEEKDFNDYVIQTFSFKNGN